MSKFFKEAVKTNYDADELQKQVDRMKVYKPSKLLTVGFPTIGTAGSIVTLNPGPAVVGWGVRLLAKNKENTSKIKKMQWQDKVDEMRRIEKDTGVKQEFRGLNRLNKRIVPAYE